MTEELNLAAARLGVKPQTLRNFKLAGMPLILRPGATDWEACERWMRDRNRGQTPKRQQSRRSQSAGENQSQTGTRSGDKKSYEDLVKERLVEQIGRERVRKHREKISLRKDRGLLVSRASAEAAMERFAAEAKNLFLGYPDQVAELVAAESDVGRVKATLLRTILDVLLSLESGRPFGEKPHVEESE